MTGIFEQAVSDVSAEPWKGHPVLERYLRENFWVEAAPDNPNALRPGIDVVAVDNTANWWPRDPLAEIFHFRGREVDRLGWRNHINFMDTPFKNLYSETDNSDMQGTVYFVKRFMSGEIACVVRIHPSIDHYGRDVSMIGLNLPHLVDREDGLPLAKDFFETSRVILDDDRLPRRLADGGKNPDRTRASLDCLAASVVFSHMQGYKGFFCFMPVRIWEVAYKSMGLDVVRLGGDKTMRDTEDAQPYDVYAGYMLFSDAAIDTVKRMTCFSEQMFFYGVAPHDAVEKLGHILNAERTSQPTYSQDHKLGSLLPT